jgi:predicted O-methyltransferase YrrM
MDKAAWKEVDDYLGGLLAPSDPVLDSAQSTAAAAGMPAISVSPLQGKMLQVLAMSIRARSILEIGTLGGYSTIWLARGLAQGGRLITLEKERKHAEVAKASITRAGFANVVEVRVGAALNALPKLDAEGRGPFDLIFIDADKSNIPSYFEWAIKLSHSGTLIVVDNVVREGEVTDAGSEDPSTRGVRRFFDMASVTPRVTCTAIQTVGLKGYDGFALAVVN